MQIIVIHRQQTFVSEDEFCANDCSGNVFHRKKIHDWCELMCPDPDPGNNKILRISSYGKMSRCLFSYEKIQQSSNK